MPTNHYFNNYPTSPSPESLLMEDLVIESIQIYGADVYYLPRTPLSSTDMIYGENPGSIFSAAYPVDVYMSDIVRGGGGGEFFAKFGLEVRDPMKLILARRTFQKYIPDLARPREGDLIYMPQLENVYEIKFVEEEKDFHSLGRRPPMFYYYELQLELFKYNNERFRTGNDEIDRIGVDYSYTIRLNMDPGGAGAFQVGENIWLGANNSYANATVTGVVKAWDRTNRKLDIVNIKGIFTNGGTVKANTSAAQWVVTDSNRRDFDQVLDELVDNDDLQDEANSVIDFTVTNPFGTPGG